MLELPIPGNVLGMVLLLFLLLSGMIRMSMIEDVSNFMLKHLFFFFIPAAVGLITCFSYWKENGPPLCSFLWFRPSSLQWSPAWQSRPSLKGDRLMNEIISSLAPYL
ncbi:MAG: CidA/LrgA family protein [Methanosarcinaceae archaeon]|nr:CidA/LrgA family protein [Methanosarcinaceae archaeon]